MSGAAHHGRISGAELRYLDEAAVRSAAQADPALFVRHDGLLVLDEVQRVPDLMLAIKHVVDVDPRPGRFLLTGSAWLLALRDIPDLLPGRSETIELWPLSQGEIERTAECFVDAVFEYGAEQMVAQTVIQSAQHREDYLDGHCGVAIPRPCAARTLVDARASSSPTCQI